jgi:hypothetical protein
MKLKRAYIRDSRFVSEDRLTIKVAYVSIEVPTKGQVSLDPKPHQTITKIKFGFPLSNPHKGEGNTNFLRFTTTLVTPEQHVTPRISNLHDLVDHMFKRHYELSEFKIEIQNLKLSSSV